MAYEPFPYTRQAIALVNGDNDDVAVDPSLGNDFGAFVAVTGPDDAFAITGLTGGVDGRRVVVCSEVAQVMTIKNEAAGSIEANRILTGAGGDIAEDAEAGATLEFIYNPVLARWCLLRGCTKVNYTPDGTFWVNCCVQGNKYFAKGMWHVAADGTLIDGLVSIVETGPGYVNRIGRVQGSTVVQFVDEAGYLYDAAGAPLGAGGTPEPGYPIWHDHDFGHAQDQVEVNHPYWCGPHPPNSTSVIPGGLKIGTNTGNAGTTNGFGFWYNDTRNTLLRRGLGASAGLLCGIEIPLDATSGSGGIGGDEHAPVYIQIRDAVTFALLHSVHATYIEDFINASTDPDANKDQLGFNEFHVSAS
jgi:hypothetical protein